ncbi:hypothetical protein [Limnoglobus roseus]|uniref:Zinc ribbon domain-containing protein n=1 Tax=Limnoglobus roseus TaxID=2598579 RepID=A0A5C1ADU1_9BACT|nr:hypothetical protein [Limnoglobus roseus]QEL15284.1 hypothetical protein PX52LOC_02199 [Limnoglobus roseus]
MAPPVYDIPPDRQAMYYGGMVLSGLGLLLFLSNFCVIASLADRGHVSVPSVSSGPSFGGFFARGLGGMLLMAAGRGLTAVGQSGWAGAGVVLNPQQARKDLEPMNRAAGGLLNDVLEEVDALKASPAEPTVKVRCRACRALNDEAAKFCDQCGKAM